MRGKIKKEIIKKFKRGYCITSMDELCDELKYKGITFDDNMVIDVVVEIIDEMEE